MNIVYPTELHEKAAEEITGYFSQIEAIKAVLLTCSCARGKATKDSCLDIAILYLPSIEKDIKSRIIKEWDVEYGTNKIFQEYKKIGKYSHIDLEFIDGDFKEGHHGWTTGPDNFELEIGNFVAYSIPLYTRDNYYNELRSIWLPYYNEERRQKRLSIVKGYCSNNLRHIPIYVQRKLYFQCFNRLYHAIGEFLQALFITNRTYPISYNKWIKEQLCEILNFPSIYNELVKMMEYRQFESEEHNKKAEFLENLLTQFCRE